MGENMFKNELCFYFLILREFSQKKKRSFRNKITNIKPLLFGFYKYKLKVSFCYRQEREL